MSSYSDFRDCQLSGNLLIGKAFCQKLKHLKLPGSQWIRGILDGRLLLPLPGKL